MRTITKAGTALATISAVAVLATGTAHAEEAAPIASQEANTAAMEKFSATVGVATTTGALVGTGIGAVVGCAIGGGLTAPTVVFVPAGCLAGLVTGAAVGGVIGTLVVGGPTALVAGGELVAVLLTPVTA